MRNKKLESVEEVIKSFEVENFSKGNLTEWVPLRLKAFKHYCEICKIGGVDAVSLFDFIKSELGVEYPKRGFTLLAVNDKLSKYTLIWISNSECTSLCLLLEKKDNNFIPRIVFPIAEDCCKNEDCNFDTDQNYFIKKFYCESGSEDIVIKFSSSLTTGVNVLWLSLNGHDIVLTHEL